MIDNGCGDVGIEGTHPRPLQNESVVPKEWGQIGERPTRSLISNKIKGE